MIEKSLSRAQRVRQLREQYAKTARWLPDRIEDIDREERESTLSKPSGKQRKSMQGGKLGKVGGSAGKL